MHPTLDGLERDRDGQMGLPGARRSQEDDILRVLDEAPRGEFVDLLPVDGRLEAEVETLQGLEVRKPRHRRAHGHLALGLAGHLLGQTAVEESGIREILLTGFLEQRVHPLEKRRQAQAAQGVVEAGELGLRHGCPPHSPAARRRAGLGPRRQAAGGLARPRHGSR